MVNLGKNYKNDIKDLEKITYETPNVIHTVELYWMKSNYY